MGEMATLLQFWGKSDAECSDNYHPLLFHLLDIGFVTLLMWDHVLPFQFKKQVSLSLGVSEIEARQVVVLLSAQHDLGKASAFQFKVENLWQMLLEAGIKIDAPDPKPAHGYVTAKILPKFVHEGVGGWKADMQIAKILAKITGGHHGTFPTAHDLSVIHQTTTGDALWIQAQKKLLEILHECLFPGVTSVEIPLASLNSDVVPLIGGLISVADWLGSSQEHFPPVGPLRIEDYVRQSRKNAIRVLADYGWTPLPTFATPVGFQGLFPFTPNPMQEQVVRFTDGAEEPYLLIIEAAMGEGKTEAALYAVDHGLATGQSHGFYIALPTQATGNAMFQRVLGDYLKVRQHRGDLNLQLVHSGSFLSTPFDKLKLAAIYGGDNADGDGRVIAESWFTYRKRPLLAPFGVGTIDQSLMGILQTKHWFVRLFGLAGKVVVFDEIHAYDVYTSTLLKRLISWLKILNCRVILLSATLPEAKRRELIAAWDENVTPEPAAYPRVTCVLTGQCETKTVAQTNSWSAPVN